MNLEFYFDLSSPAAYLAWTQLPKIIDETGAKLIWKPVFLGGIFKELGNMPPSQIPIKANYLIKDRQRYAQLYGVSLANNPYAPINTLNFMRFATAVMETKYFDGFIKNIYLSIWQEGLNLNDENIISEVIKNIGIDINFYKKTVSDMKVKKNVIDNNMEAMDRGVFGVPTFFVGDEMFFGQDRMKMLKNYLMS